MTDDDSIDTYVPPPKPRRSIKHLIRDMFLWISRLFGPTPDILKSVIVRNNSTFYVKENGKTPRPVSFLRCDKNGQFHYRMEDVLIKVHQGKTEVEMQEKVIA